MEVILIEPVHNLGDAEDVVKVKPGYARNYLIPQGLARLATKNALRELEEKKRQASHKQEFIKQKAQGRADELTGVSLTIETLAGGDGKLFGSVTPLIIANQLQEKGFEIDRKKITIDDIRTTGDYVATIHLHKEVKAEIPVLVISTTEAAEMAEAEAARKAEGESEAEVEASETVEADAPADEDTETAAN